MKNKLMGYYDKIMLQRRGIIESVNGILMTVFDIDHIGRRSPVNALTHILGAVAAYSFYEDKPRVFNPENIQYRWKLSKTHVRLISIYGKDPYLQKTIRKLGNCTFR